MSNLTDAKSALERILKYAKRHPDDTLEDRERDMMHIEHHAYTAIAIITAALDELRKPVDEVRE